MQTVYCFVLALLAVLIVSPAPAIGQNLPNEMLREGRGETDEIKSANEYEISVAPTVFPDAPVRQKVIDRKFIAVLAALGGAETLRFTTHKLVLDHEYAAGAPWVVSVPSNQHLIAKYAGIYAAELLLAYELKKPHSWLPGDKVIRKLWWAYPAAMMPIHIKNGVRSIRTQAPSCPVDQCGT